MATHVDWDDYIATVDSGMGVMDTWTAVFDLPVRPAEELLGSLVMHGAWTDPSSFVFNLDSGVELRWTWDGEDPHYWGFHWRQDLLTCPSPTDNLGCNVPMFDGVVTGDLDYTFYVANTSIHPRDYNVAVQVFQIGGHAVERDVHIVEDVAAHSWRQSEVSGTLSLDDIRDPGRYRLEVSLYHDFDLQDHKYVLFDVL
jgi:hypothetical protein